jgi:hypothetical protein
MNAFGRKGPRFSHLIFVAVLLASTGSPAAAFLAVEALAGLHDRLER